MKQLGLDISFFLIVWFTANVDCEAELSPTGVGGGRETETEREYAAFTSTGLIMMTSLLHKTQWLQEWNFEEDNWSLLQPLLRYYF